MKCELRANFRPVKNKGTIKAIESGEDNWKEMLDTAVIVRCTSPLKRNAYEIIRDKGDLVPLFTGVLMAYVLVPKIGRVFIDGHGGMVVETALSGTVNICSR